MSDVSLPIVKCIANSIKIHIFCIDLSAIINNHTWVIALTMVSNVNDTGLKLSISYIILNVNISGFLIIASSNIKMIRHKSMRDKIKLLLIFNNSEVILIHIKGSIVWISIHKTDILFIILTDTV